MAEVEERRYVDYVEVSRDIVCRSLEVRVVYSIPLSLVRQSTQLTLDVLAETVALQVKEAVAKARKDA